MLETILANIAVVGAELLMGMALGFFLSDGRSGLSLEEVKVSSMVFLLSNAFVMLTHPAMTVGIFGFLAIAWAIINVGMMTGELIRLGFVRYILNVIAKKDVQLAVSDYVRLATRYGFTGQPGDLSAALMRLADVQDKLQRIHRRAARFDDGKTLGRIRMIADLCREYQDVADIVYREKDMERRQFVLSQWGELGNTLTELSWESLNHAEVCVKRKINQAWQRQHQEARG